jgi:DNA-binding PadR family transcriptional regulator
MSNCSSDEVGSCSELRYIEEMSTPVERPNGPLTHIELQILFNLAAGPSHGYVLMRAISASSEGKVKTGPGTLYVAMKRLVQAGFAEELAPARASARPRRTYAITTRGHAAMREELARLRQIVDRAALAGWLNPPETGRT